MKDLTSKNLNTIKELFLRYGEDNASNSLEYGEYINLYDGMQEIRNDFLESQIGKTLEVLVEEYHEGYAQGYTKNYTPVRIACGENLHGIVKAKITAVSGDFCIGEI